MAKTEAIQPGYCIAIHLVPDTAPEDCYIGIVDVVDQHGILMNLVHWDDKLDMMGGYSESLFVPWGNINSMLISTEKQPTRRFMEVATTLPHGLHDQEGIGLPPYYYFIPFLRYKREAKGEGELKCQRGIGGGFVSVNQSQLLSPPEKSDSFVSGDRSLAEVWRAGANGVFLIGSLVSNPFSRVCHTTLASPHRRFCGTLQ